MKECCKCKQELSLHAFNKRKGSKDGYQNICRECSKQKSKDYYYENQERLLAKAKLRARSNHLLDRYGITEYDYNWLLLKQDGTCAICNDICLTFDNLSVDHDNKTGKVRGLLCNNCNTGLGRFRDDPKIMIKAIEYLEKGPIVWEDYKE